MSFLDSTIHSNCLYTYIDLELELHLQEFSSIFKTPLSLYFHNEVFQYFSNDTLRNRN